MPLSASLSETVFVPAAFAVVAVASRSVSLGGAATGAGLALCLYAGAGRGGFASLAAFVVLGSLATRVGHRRKEALGIAQTQGGRRGSLHALSNCGVAAACGAMLLWVPTAVWVRYALIGSLATAACDTLGTEIGQAVRGRTWLLLPLRTASPGAPGAVSLAGTLAGLVGACVVGICGAAFGMVPWTGVWVVALAAVAASGLESLLYQRGPRGCPGHVGNLLNTVIGALLAASLAAVATAA